MSSIAASQNLHYRDTPGIVGTPFFDCHRLHASLTVRTCGTMWIAAKEGSERHGACRACPIGATHVGVANVSQSDLCGARVCARCVRGTGRLVHSNLCVSCYNREREVIRGRNARGQVPVKLARLEPRRVCYVSMGTGAVNVARAEHTSSSGELIVATLRDSVHAVVFGWRPQAVGLRQLRLF